jgi:hypothetical protein
VVDAQVIDAGLGHLQGLAGEAVDADAGQLLLLYGRAGAAPNGGNVVNG